MQDLRSITGGSGGRIFGGERRLRPYPNQALKCPRCDSLNTKFCYYNNYNLSQPRHFCKNCRRYWTKGGVLRNVPVGGGCRKTKRSKPKPSTDLQKERKSNSHSSSESSSLTATTTNTVTEAASSSSAGLLGFPFVSQNPNPNPNPNPNFEPSMLENLEHNPNFESFCENGSFTSLMTVSNPSILGFNFNGISPFRLHQQQQEQERIRLEQDKMTNMVEEMKMQQELTAGCVDQTVPVSLPGFQNRMSNGELTALDWQSSGDHGHDQGLFDMANTVDHGYWSQSQWTDNDHHLYLP